jgi:DNA-binding NarL/FixJ family response regulator
VLLEREAEIALLRGGIDRAAQGTGSLVVVEGDPGIGKTSLLEAAIEVARRRELDVLTSRGGELEREMTFGVARQLLETRAMREPEVVLAAGARHAGPLLGAGDGREDVDEPSLVHALFWACTNLAAERPLVVAVDDAHWSDTASLKFLVYLARRLEELPIALLVAARTGEPDAPQSLLDMLAAHAGDARLRPAPLTPPASYALVRSAAGDEIDDRVARTVHEMAGGNPLLLREAATIAASEGTSLDTIPALRPQTLGRSVLRRLDRLGPAATPVARAVALLSRDASLPHVAALTGLGPDEAAAAADELVAARVLSPGQPLQFVHPLMRSALYGSIPAGERSRGHARAARVLADAGVSAARVVPHLLAAEPAGDPGSVALLCRASAAEPDPRRAATALRRALEEPPDPQERPRVLLKLGQAEMRAYDPEAIEHLLEGRAQSTDPDEQLAATQALARAWTLAPRPEDALTWAREELAAFEGADEGREREVRLALMALEAIRGEVTPEQARERRALAGAAATPAERYLLAALAYKAADFGTAPDAAELAELALAGGLSAEGIRGTGAILVMAALMNADEVDRAAEVSRGALDLARDAGDVSGAALALTMHADAKCRAGALADAESESREALEMADQHALAWAEPVAIATLIESLAEQGRGDEADHVVATRELTEWQADTGRAALYLHARARVRLAQRRPAEALEDFRRSGEVMKRYGVDNPAVQGWRSGAAEALLRMGEVEEARALAAEELELARPFAARHAIGAALRVAGIAEGGDAGTEMLRQAVDVLADSQSSLVRARALVDLGAALRRSGDRAESREPLREGLDLAHRCGAKQLADHAEQELAASGARPRRRAISGIDALTPSQVRIAGMAAEGQANREIAQALFLSVRTVENQLRQVYLKLDIASRRELAGALAESGSER